LQRRDIHSARSSETFSRHAGRTVFVERGSERGSFTLNQLIWLLAGQIL
jgi:hypothetical protein